jgi:hypothetical protein
MDPTMLAGLAQELEKMLKPYQEDLLCFARLPGHGMLRMKSLRWAACRSMKSAERGFVSGAVYWRR